MKKTLSAFVWIFLAGMMALPVTLPAAEKGPLVFGVHPFVKPTEIAKKFKPVTEFLSKELNREIQIVVGKSYEDIADRYQKGEVDFGFMGPSLYALESEKGLVFPLARIVVDGKGTFQGVIIVKEDSPVKKISDLRGESFAFGDPESTLSHYMPHYMLMEQGIQLKDLSKYAFVGNHDNVAINVLQGNFVAGGLKPDVARKYLDKGLRELAISEPVPEHLFVAGLKLDEGIRQKITAALLKADVELLKPINKSITGMEIAKREDYAGLRKLMVEVDQNDPAEK
jgi:phosphonate transport system substrate-binding protein